MWGKGLVGTRVKLASNLIDKIPEHGHRAAAKYLNYELQKMTITTSALADCRCLSFLAWLRRKIAPVQLEQVERVTHRTLERAVSADQLKDRKSVLVANDLDFYSSFFIFSAS